MNGEGWLDYFWKLSTTERRPPRDPASVGLARGEGANGDISTKQIGRNGSEKIESLASRSSNPCTRSRAPRFPPPHLYSLSRLLSFYPADRCLSDRTRKHYFHPPHLRIDFTAVKRNAPHISRLPIKRSSALQRLAIYSKPASAFFSFSLSLSPSRLHQFKHAKPITNDAVNLNAVRSTL